MKRAPSRHIKEIDKIVRPYGWAWKMGGGHVTWTGPQGQRVYTSATASDSQRALKNALRDFKKEGLDISA